MDKTLVGLLQPDPKILDQLQHETVVLPSILKLQPEQKEAPDYAALLEAARIRPTDHIEPPAVAWQMLNERGEFDTLGHCGDFSVIIGKAKSRKSFLINIAVCASIKDEASLGVIKSDLHNKEVLYFDTEQSDYYVKKAIDRICKATNIDNPKNLNVFALRKYSPQERLNLVEYAIYNTPNLGFVIIDGIKDLITSINDEEQATMIASKLMKWTTETNCHIVTVLHQNKSDTNARGHIGTELINKAETVLSVTKSDKDKEISVVEPLQTRAKEPEMFAFEIIDGLPVLANDWKIRTEASVSKIDVTQIDDYKLYQMLNRVYSNGDAFGYSELTNQIKLAFKAEFNRDLGLNKIKEIITQCKNSGYLYQPIAGKSYSLAPFKSGLAV
jgi:hypothetical protein